MPVTKNNRAVKVKRNEKTPWYMWIAYPLMLIAGLYFAVVCRQTWHYDMSYQERVREEIRSMVKPECLKGN